jgi:uncharacterized membrane protein YqjE
MQTQAVLMQLARHLSCYVQLGATAASEYRSAWVRRLVLMVVALVTFAAGLVALWVAGLVGLWDTPWRLAYVVISATVLLGVAAITCYSAVKARVAGPASQVFGSELRKDLELFNEWKSTL